MTFKLRVRVSDVQANESQVTLWPGGTVVQEFQDGTRKEFSHDQMLKWPWVQEWIQDGHSLRDLDGKAVLVAPGKTIVSPMPHA